MQAILPQKQTRNTFLPDICQLPELTPQHYRELVQKRDLNPDWVAVNCKSIDARTATERLGYKAHSDGLLLSGHGYQEQFKPDEPWPSQDGKRPKYRSCKDEDGYDAMLPAHPDKKRLWDDLEALKDECYQIDGHPCLVVTEGFFKAISLTSHGVPTVGLLGVEMGLTSVKSDPQGKRYLVPGLERLARAGFGFIIAFDADCARKKGVIDAQIKLAHQLSLFSVPVYSITGMWEEAEGKGIDDYIQMNSFEEFRDKVLARSLTIERWKEKHLGSLERQLSQDSKTPTPASIAREIGEEYENKLAFNDEANTWMRYEAQDKGVWSPESDRYIRLIITQVLEGKGAKFKTQTYVKQVMECLEVDPRILKRKWTERSPNEVLPHHNGVLEIATRKFVEHSPLNYLTWTLPREYNPLAEDWSKINAWLDEVSQGNPVVKNLLICFAQAVLTGKSGLQKMMHLIGLGGSGKTTYSNLVTDLIGENNVLDIGAEEFCTNRFAPVRAYLKRLVLFSDEQELPKNIGNIMKMIGGNSLSGEQKGKPAFQFPFTGMAMLVSEHPIAQGIKGNGWKRRIIPVAMNKKIADKDRRDLRAEFKPELAAFTNYLLSLDDNFVTQTLRGVGDIPVCKLQFWQSRLREDSIAAWLNDCVIYDQSVNSAIGGDRNEADKRTPETLFGSYADFCKRSGMTSKSKNRFSSELIELCQSGLGWEVSKFRTASATRIKGIRLRVEAQDDHILTHEQSLVESVRTPDEQSVKQSVMTETPSVSGCVDCEDLTLHTPTINREDSPELSKQPEKEIISEPKSPLAKLTLSDKKKWLKKNKDNKPTVWVNHPMYTGEAILDGRYGLDDNPWRFTYQDRYLYVKPENIEIFEALCGDIQPISDPPEGNQIALSFDVNQPSKPETPIQRVKRLAKQLKIKLTPDDFNFSIILENYQKSELQELTGEELTKIADRWETQINDAKQRQKDNRITKYLEE